jgi:hypothetical protein
MEDNLLSHLAEAYPPSLLVEYTRQDENLRLTAVTSYLTFHLHPKQNGTDRPQHLPSSLGFQTPTFIEGYGQQPKGTAWPQASKRAKDRLAQRRVDMEKLGIEPRTFSTQQVQ